MHTRVLKISLLTLSFLGIADAWYLADAALNKVALSCNIAALDGCNIVAQSPYSKLFGLPLALYGVVFYAVIFALAALLFVLPTRIVFRSLYVLGIAGVVASVCFLSIQFFLIHAVCMYCIASAAIAVLIWLIARSLTRSRSFARVAAET